MFKPLFKAFYFGSFIEAISFIPNFGLTIFDIFKLILQIILAYIGLLQIKHHRNQKN